MKKRRLASERELAVNEADAPGLYLGVVPISKDGSRLKFGRAGTIVEWAVHLRRFDETRTLDRLVKRNELNLEIIAKLAGVVPGPGSSTGGKSDIGYISAASRPTGGGRLCGVP